MSSQTISRSSPGLLISGDQPMVRSELATRLRLKRPEALRSCISTSTRFLKALANANRLLVLCALVEGEKSVGELNAAVPLSQSALSQHLAILRKDELVATRRESQTIYYSIASPEVFEMIEHLLRWFGGAPDAAH